jgi:hypothetical protein
MAKTKVDLVNEIMEQLLPDSYMAGNIATIQALQKVSNKHLAIINEILQETLVCRKPIPGKGYCKNPRQRKKSYCGQHNV